MKIDETSIFMASARNSVEKDEERERLRVWSGQPDQELRGDRVSLSSKSKCCLADTDISISKIEAESLTKHEITLKKLLVEILSGRKTKYIDLSKVRKTQEAMNDPQGTDPEFEQSAGWGVQYNHSTLHEENEDLSFVAAGIIRTADGQEREFSLRLDMSRKFISSNNLSFRAGDALLMDPLVVNFDGTAAELSEKRFSFDLNSDGVEENISALAPGHGFLAFDRNNDDIINNGSELFGPHTGDGFAELAEHDPDGNNWIDENDPIYEKLSVWIMDNQGNRNLSSLKDRGIGAIYLGNLSSKFDLKGRNNELMGQISNTGVFLYENGKPGTIQQLDLVA
jgi:hypothetical protein